MACQAAGPGGGWHEPAAGLAGKGPVRGYPPAPGQPPPVYPPGQFSAWNRVPSQADNGYWDTHQGTAGRAAAGYPESPAADRAGPWYPEPGQARLAVGETRTGETRTGEHGPARRGPASHGPASHGPASHGPARHGLASLATLEPAYSVLAVSDPADGTSAESGESVEASLSAGSRAAQPGSGGQQAETGRQAVPQRSPAARTDRPQPRRAHARARGGRRAGGLLIACGLVFALSAGIAVYLWFSAGRHGAGHAAAAPKRPAGGQSQPQSAAPTATQSLGRWGHIRNRAADPQPLTLTELFPAAFTAGGSGYARTVERDGTDCAKAVIGSALQTAVRLGKCTQVMRASYLSHNSKLMGTIGVLNLASVAAAERSGKAAGGGDFIAQLAAAKGPASHLTRGTGLEETEIKGHFLVMVWAEFASLHAPTAKWQRLELETFCNRLIQNTANLSLASRMITGTPRTP